MKVYDDEKEVVIKYEVEKEWDFQFREWHRLIYSEIKVETFLTRVICMIVYYALLYMMKVIYISMGVNFWKYTDIIILCIAVLLGGLVSEYKLFLILRRIRKELDKRTPSGLFEVTIELKPYAIRFFYGEESIETIRYVGNFETEEAFVFGDRFPIRKNRITEEEKRMIREIMNETKLKTVLGKMR